MNNPLATLPERALHLAGQVGSGIKGAVPGKAVEWMETGAALAALKTGGRVATRVVRRNPALAAAAVVGAGVLWLTARHRAKKREQHEALEGKSKRIEARRAPRKRATARNP
jgi:hypothetical protein